MERQTEEGRVAGPQTPPPSLGTQTSGASQLAIVVHGPPGALGPQLTATTQVPASGPVPAQPSPLQQLKGVQACAKPAQPGPASTSGMQVESERLHVKPAQQFSRAQSPESCTQPPPVPPEEPALLPPDELELPLVPLELPPVVTALVPPWLPVVPLLLAGLPVEPLDPVALLAAAPLDAPPPLVPASAAVFEPEQAVTARPAMASAAAPMRRE